MLEAARGGIDALRACVRETSRPAESVYGCRARRDTRKALSGRVFPRVSSRLTRLAETPQRPFMPSELSEHMRAGLPRARAGEAIGLLGGSFDPPHAGHVHITLEALKRFRLDRVWWLVSPGNPLKPDSPAAIERRMAAARDMMQHPRVVITDIERRLGTRYTAETLDGLRGMYRNVRFVWLMGADNLASFHKWEQWQRILNTVPVGIIARPSARVAARTSPAAARYRKAQLTGRAASLLPQARPPAWCFVNVPMVNLSSSDIRARGEWLR